MFPGNPWLLVILSPVPQSNPQTMMSTACKREPNILWKHVSTAYLLASSQHLAEFREAQVADTVCSTIINYCQNDWTTKQNTLLQIKPYWLARGQLTAHDDLLLYGQRIVVPAAMQQVTLSEIHRGHQGIQKCRLRPSISVWWPGISKHIKDLIEQCPLM